ncbi:MAG: hypothetical protein LQ349_009153, partial [Xanthoria aureola]
HNLPTTHKRTPGFLIHLVNYRINRAHGAMVILNYSRNKTPSSLFKLQRCGNPAPIQAADKRHITNQATPQVLQEGLPLLPKRWDHLKDPFKTIQFITRTIHPKSRSSAPSVEVIILMAQSTRHEQMTV